ncbi:MAG: PHP domain-containing protein [Candidatus Omnitrophica bacterium]|nr:PHP domain-containing protein [Candidatus Omnitrophota bacterium]
MSNQKRCDLHLHTLHSDGTLSPRELVQLAKQKGLSCIALTDHDTLSGIEEAQAEGNRAGVEVIAGVEISVKFDPGTMHILGYFVDRHSEKLKEGLADVQEARRKRNPMIIEKLNALGIKISLSEVERESGGDQVGRPHFARVLVQKKYVKNFEEAFDKYLAKGAPAYVDKRKLTSREAIEMIEEAGGIASLAHPKQLKLNSVPERFEQTIEQLKSEGLKGLEVYSSCQSKEEAARYRKTAERLGLFVTGGSDFHGANRPQAPLGWMGDGAMIPYETIDQMKKVLLERKIK